MKKIFLSLFIIGTFIAYAFTYRINGEDDEGVVKAPASFTAKTTANSTNYKEGEFTGKLADAYYGNVRIKVKIKNGRLTEVKFLDYPHDRQTSERINQQAMPYLQQEAIQAQSASVDIISGATQTSKAFIESLKSALSQAS